MKDKTIKQEFDFLITLKVLATQALLEYKMKDPAFPETFDIAKGLSVLERAIDGELDYLEQNPDDYLEIYGE